MNRFTFLFLLLFPLISFSQDYTDSSTPVEERVTDLLSKMTLDEKIDYIGGYNSFDIRNISRLKTPLTKMSDGPVGVRNYGNTTAYPAGILAAATWNPDLIEQEGEALGKDARARGVNILLGPGVNIYRAPMCGRNFEYFGEDPYLSGRMAAAYIKGVQSQGVVATVKHFVANNQEWDRNNVSSNMDERTLQEIYLPAFKAAVKNGKVGCVMNSYNLLNNIHCSQNNHLLNEILKDNWGFDGFVMSDWSSTYNGIAAAKGGLDLEMPSAAFMNLATLKPAIENGTLSEKVIDEKVERILRILFRFGFFDRPQTDSSIPLNNTDNSTVALNVAREGIVLLKNQDAILPLDTNNISSLAVIGAGADSYLAGGGSSYTSPFNSVSILDGIQAVAGNKFSVNFSGVSSNYQSIARNSVFYEESDSEVQGLKGEYFKNQNLSGTADFTRTDEHIDFHWSAKPDVTGFPADNFSIRWTGVIRPVKSGNYTFYVRGDDGFRLYINNNRVIDLWNDHAATVRTVNMDLQAGKEYAVRLDFYENGGDAEITFGYYNINALYNEAKEVAQNADAAIVCVGFNSSTEGEGFDRPFVMPDNQDSLISAVTSVNSNTIVIVNAGGNVSMMSWIDKIKGLVHAWYPGQDGGTAIADILFGKVNPSGKLPVTFEKKWEDNPTYDSYYDPDGDKKVEYTEGLLVGYRYYDTDSVEPLFPFGYGLSYTNFEYSNLVLSQNTSNGGQGGEVSFDIENTGDKAGAEVAQVYVHQVNSPVMRPMKELKGFSKIFLQPGEKGNVTVDLDSSSFAYFKTEQNGFGMDDGDFLIMVGASSRDIRLADTLMVAYQTLPVLENITLLPENNATDVPLDQEFKITFSRPVNFDVSNSMVIKDALNDEVVATIPADELHGYGSNSLFFDAPSSLKENTEYYIEIAPDAVMDYYGNTFEGIQSNDQWHFRMGVETSVDENDLRGELKMYPNPANDKIYFNSSQNEKTFVQIFKAEGDLIANFSFDNLTDHTQSYDCSGLNNGVYFCKITSGNKTIVRKIMIQK